MHRYLKLLSLVFFISFYNLLYCQNTIIEYQFKTIESVQREFLIFNNTEAFYFDYVEKDNLPIKSILENYNINRGGQKMFRSLNDLNSVKLIKAFPKTRDQFLIEDIKSKINWKIQKEKQTILGFICYKALGEFRGRKYIVWFTNQLPISLGPWKFDGLPGIILKVENSDGVNSYQAIQIVSNSVNGIPKSIYTFLEDFDKTKAIRYQDYIVKENEHLKIIQEQSIAYMPKGITNYTIPYFRSAMREFNFEWNNFEPKNP